MNLDCVRPWLSDMCVLKTDKNMNEHKKRRTFHTYLSSHFQLPIFLLTISSKNIRFLLRKWVAATRQLCSVRPSTYDGRASCGLFNRKIQLLKIQAGNYR